MLLRVLVLLVSLVVPASAATRLNVAIGADVNVVEVHKTLLGPGFQAQQPDEFPKLWEHPRMRDPLGTQLRLIIK